MTFVSHISAIKIMAEPIPMRLAVLEHRRMQPDPMRVRTRKGRYDYSAALDRQMPRLTAKDKAQPTAVEGDINISSTGATEFIGGKWKAK
jgi:hypothetical protein